MDYKIFLGMGLCWRGAPLQYDVNTMRAVIGRWSTDAQITSRGNLFSLFCSTWRAVLKMSVRLLKQVTASKKSLAGAIYKKEKWRNRHQKSS